ncbi:WbqC family protein [Streptomyces sp. NBC_00199]|uniref:WbqC family protein n=1 Tax=Streptomyces sp. NBC_00199 TaxID=2975678 RepID=UPI00225AE596|nr:WbqC family protein [Streptomyces sp. NBC_00199]MCX5265887.1 WbqC family protein [Streptomyces sp. NBC_00199]
MTLTSASWAPASTAASSVPELPGADAPGRLCAIHQPNPFPRLSTLAKLYAADRWIVLDDVQFARRDYQHRAVSPPWTIHPDSSGSHSRRTFPTGARR